MRHEKHRDCSHALEEDAPKAWGPGSYSKWVKGATERRTPWSGGVHRNGGNKKITQELGTAYVGIQGEGGRGPKSGECRLQKGESDGFQSDKRSSFL